MFWNKHHKLKDKIQVIIPKKVDDQIKYLCKEISTIEWSGVLFYTLEGSIKDPKNCKITLEEILPLDKGTSGATSYELGINVVKFMAKHNAPEKNWKVGHIHSHHSMSVFFSGTDEAELRENSANHNFYLSVIVNNKHEIIGKVGIKSSNNLPENIEEIGYTALDEEGKEYVLEKVITEKQDSKFFEYDCEIKFEEPEIQVSDEFKELMTKMGTHPSSFSREFGYGKGTDPSYRGYGSQFLQKNYEDNEDNEDLFNKKSQVSTFYNKKSSIEEKVDEFSFQLLACGSEDALKLSNIEDILDYYNVMDVDPDFLAKEILDRYESTLKTIYPIEATTPKIYVLRNTIKNYESFMSKANKDIYNLLEPTVAKLKAKHKIMLNKVQ